MFPNFHEKLKSHSIVSAKLEAEYDKKMNNYSELEAPKRVIVLYQRSSNNYVKSKYGLNKADKNMSYLNLVDSPNGKIGILGDFGIGAPVLALYLEGLIEWGVKEFISVGTAGTLSSSLDIGDIVVCDKAIRDEGTSHHYLPPEKYAHASPELTSNLKNILSDKKICFTSGASWTTDAPYMETEAEVRQYQQEGIIAVEMENSALFAISKHRNVKAASIIIISDDLSDLKWKPHFHNPKINKQMRSCIDLLISIS